MSGPANAEALGARDVRLHEHPLLGTPRRDTIVTVLLAVATATIFVLMANHGSREVVQRMDDAFVRRMVSIRTGWLTVVAKFFNVLGLVYVTLPVRLAIAGFLALRRRWWRKDRSTERSS